MFKARDLKCIELLSGLTDPELETVAAAIHLKEFRRNDVVVHKGQPSSELYFLLKGRLKVIDYSTDGREVGFIFINKGSHFGELALIDGKSRSASIIATETSLVAVLPGTAAKNLMYEVPTVSEKLLKQLATIIRANNEHIVMLGNGSAYTRICILLRKYTRDDNGTLVIERLPTQTEIAIMTNTTRETVSRTLNQLVDQGIVQKSGKRLIILASEALERAGMYA